MSAPAARTVRSRLLAAPSTPSLSPRSFPASTTSTTCVSRSAYVAATCREPVRSETGQWIRRRRSPIWKGRIPANSVPSPRRADWWSPTRPLGWGSGARASNVEGSGTVARRRGSIGVGPLRKAPHALVAATRPGPTSRCPQRVDRTANDRSTSPGSRGAAAVQAPDVGRKLIQGPSPSTAARWSVPAVVVTRAVQVVASPSRSVEWARWVEMRGASRGRVSTDHRAMTSSGVAPTSKSGRPKLTEAMATTIPITQARRCEVVGFHGRPPTTVTSWGLPATRAPPASARRRAPLSRRIRRRRRSSTARV